MKHYWLFFTTFLFFIVACEQKSSQAADKKKSQTPSNMNAFDYDAFLEIESNTHVQFKLKKKANENWLIVQNGTEEIKVTDYQLKDNHLSLTMPIFGSKIEADVIDGNLQGMYQKIPGEEKGQMKFRAFDKNSKQEIPRQFTDYEMSQKNKNAPFQNLSGKWSVTFSPNVADDEYPAIGEFQQDGNDIQGTFRTETGDYRFLAGKIYGHHFYLSCFDGSHAFLFYGNINGDEIQGQFHSGTHWKEPFIAKRNPNANLNDPYKLTYLQKEAKPFEFEFPNLEGQQVSLNDEQFKDKAVVVQIFGSWCPNCMDETELYTQLHKQYKKKGIEFVGVAFERGETLEKAKPTLEKYKQHFGLEYPLLFGGKASKALASEKFPMLNKIISFPTTVVLNRKHEVVKIHTGFNGPATSIYKEYEKEFRQLLDELGNE